jgi:hypothetical protein
MVSKFVCAHSRWLQVLWSVFNDLALPGAAASNRTAVYENTSRTAPMMFVLEETVCWVAGNGVFQASRDPVTTNVSKK